MVIIISFKWLSCSIDKVPSILVVLSMYLRIIFTKFSRLIWETSFFNVDAIFFPRNSISLIGRRITKAVLVNFPLLLWKTWENLLRDSKYFDESTHSTWPMAYRKLLIGSCIWWWGKLLPRGGRWVGSNGKKRKGKMH